MAPLRGSRSRAFVAVVAVVAQAAIVSAGAIPTAAHPGSTPAPVAVNECKAYQDGTKQCYTHTVYADAEPCPYALCPRIVNQCRAEWLLESQVVEVPCQNKCCPTTATQTVRTACQQCPTACQPMYTHVEYAYPTSCGHDMAAIETGSAADLMVNAVHGPSLHDLTYVLAKRMAEEDGYSPAEQADQAEQPEQAEQDGEEHHHPKPFPPLRPPPHHPKPPPTAPGIVITTKPVFTIPTWAPNLPTIVTLTHATHASRMLVRDSVAYPHKYHEGNGPFDDLDDVGDLDGTAGTPAAAGPDHPDLDGADLPPALGTATPTQRLMHHPIHGEPPLPQATHAAD